VLLTVADIALRYRLAYAEERLVRASAVFVRGGRPEA
jgi:hypothetical protein